MRITAHSGCDGWADNSMQYVRYAAALPVEAFEVDVHKRKDGTLVIAHDEDPTCTFINCPTLTEVFQAAQGAHGINCDLKDAGLEQEVCALHTSICPQVKLYFSGTVSPDTLQRFPEIAQQATILLNIEEIVPDFYDCIARGEDVSAAQKAAQVCKDCNVNIINVCDTACTVSFQKELEKQGIAVSIWTVNEVDKAKTFAQRNAYNLTTCNTKEFLKIQW